MKSLIPTFWFGGNAEEAVNYYLSVFKDARILQTTRYGRTGMMPEGTVLTISFTVNGMEFLAFNGMRNPKFSPAVSFTIKCEDQDEIDYYWERLSAFPEEEQCGWLKDKFGISWQVVPYNISELLHHADPERSSESMKALLSMKKIVISEL